MSWIGTASTSNIILFRFDVCCRPFACYDVLVAEDEERWVGTEVGVKILKCSICGLGIEEVNRWNECKVEDHPDDVESPALTLDANRRDLDNYEV